MASPVMAATPQQESVFRAFASHIEHQVELDKRLFVNASECTQWFYKQERQKADSPKPQGISLRSSRRASEVWRTATNITLNCNSRYPGGIAAAREDFSRTQSTLSLSLTFYEFALVGDRDDDGQYSSSELRDILGSFGLVFQPELASASQLSMLNAQFDSVHHMGQFDVLMAGMGLLYEKGYRFTNRDKQALSQILG